MSDEPTALERFMLGDARGGNRANVLLIVGGLGFGMFLYVLSGVFTAPGGLDGSSPTVASDTATCSFRNGALYEIEVAGKTYGGCAGATNRCAESEPVDVAYDPADPSRCRVASAVGGLGRFEMTLLLLNLGMAFAGVASVLFMLSQRIHMAAIANDGDMSGAQARVARLQRLSWVALAASAITANATAVYALL